MQREFKPANNNSACGCPPELERERQPPASFRRQQLRLPLRLLAHLTLPRTCRLLWAVGRRRRLLVDCRLVLLESLRVNVAAEDRRGWFSLVRSWVVCLRFRILEFFSFLLPGYQKGTQIFSSFAMCRKYERYVTALDFVIKYRKC